MPTLHHHSSFRPGLRRRPGHRPRPTGFTLVELLVVIGIIVLLVAIVLPTIGKARDAAQAAKTQADMVSISNAIERYYNDHRAYPGVVRNVDVTAGFQPTGAGTDNIAKNLTMSENLVLTLCGGFTYRETAPGVPGIKLQDIGKGPLNLSASAVKRVRSAPYVDATPGGLFSETWSPTDAASGMVNTPLPGPNPMKMPGIVPAGTTDSRVPEFVDAHSEPRPILYLRAVVGGTVIQDPPPTPASYEYITDAQQYNMRHVVGTYQRDRDGDFGGDFTRDPADDTDYDNTYQYLRHPTIANSPRGKDKFLLIAAGRDRRYGTIDDVIVGG